MVSTINITVPRGMLFLYDHSAKNVEIPVYVEGKTVAHSETAISIATISDEDGDTRITLTNSQDCGSIQTVEIFSGHIFLENGTLHMCVMGDEIISQIPARKGVVGIKVFSEGKLFPDSISIVIEN